MEKNNYARLTNNGSETHFSAGLGGDVERSRMTATPTCLTTFNAGFIVPIYYQEVLASDVFSVDLDFVIRQTTVLKPTMGNMMVDFYAFFVPNRVVNTAFPSVMGENVYGSWTANSVSLAPLWRPSVPATVTLPVIPVGSVADYYGYPTQKGIPSSILSQCNDLLFRGYIEIYNEYFRDQNYQPPVPYSKLNVYEGFFERGFAGGSGVPPLVSDTIPLDGASNPLVIGTSTPQDNTLGEGAVAQAIYGNNRLNASAATRVAGLNLASAFDALGAPFRANKLHDYFTSVLPSPQKGQSVFLPVAASVYAPVYSAAPSTIIPFSARSWYDKAPSWRAKATAFNQNQSVGSGYNAVQFLASSSGFPAGGPVSTDEPDNIDAPGGRALEAVMQFADLSASELGFDISALRLAASIQKVYEELGRVGSRYREYVKGFFGLEVDDPFKDIPEYLGHMRRNLDLFQTAQTSSSPNEETPQGNLAAFGYTSNGGHLFTRSFNEHGYIHIFAVVRHKNVYSSFMDRSRFRLNMLDFYQPQLANISEQPVYRKEIYPFAVDAPIGYQEAWAEYRFEPDRVSGYMRPGIDGTLAVWNYADDVPESFGVVDGEWLKSNSSTVLDRTLAVTSEVSHQFLGQFVFRVDKERPMPTYSVPGLDII